MSKRFTSNNGVFYIDNETGWEFQCYGEVVHLMNALADENEELKKKSRDKQEHITYLEGKIHRMREAIKKLEYLYHYRGQDASVDVKKEAWELKKENNNLKQRVKELECINDGLNYALENIKQIDVEVDINED